MRFSIISLFPEMFQALHHGVTGRAIENQQLLLNFFNPRDYTNDRHQSVDDKPYGGGPGMVMMPEPLIAAIHTARQQDETSYVIYLSPQGRPFDQSAAKQLITHSHLVLVSGRYEGIDERIIEQEIDAEYSIGDYILTGGELAAMVMIDTIARLIPGVVGDEASVTNDSLSSGLLKYPQYTRPEVYEDAYVPEVLLSGHHRLIAEWRLKQSLGKTWLKRPDLLAKKKLTEKEQCLLEEFMNENQEQD